jgi:DNA repair protein RecO (recombination protein O)
VATKKFSDEPAYVLHRYDWSESSLILEVFTRNYGRLALVAKRGQAPHLQFSPHFAAYAAIARELWR